VTLPPERIPPRAPSRDADCAPWPAVVNPGASVSDRTLFINLLRGSASNARALDMNVTRSIDAQLIQALSGPLLYRAEGGGPWPLQFVIDLVRRGRIKVSAGYERGVWNIALQPELAFTWRWLATRQPCCQERLARRLGQPVRVSLQQGGAQ